MSTVLSNGVIVPDVGSTNWAADLETNWTLLNALIGAVGANVRLDRPNIWTAAQTFSDGIYGDLDGTAAMAVSDANGNEIATTYALKTDVTALQTAVASKAADAEVVHLAGAETITGNKTFSEWVTATGFQQTKATISTDVAPSSTQYLGYNYANNNDGKTLLHHRAFVSANTLNNTLRYWVHPNTSTDGNNGGFQIVAYGDGSTVATFKPRGNFEPYDPNYGANLGSSSLKWKTLNGINPGMLSFPADSFVNLDTTSWDLTGVTFTYTPPSDGWLMINVRPSNNFSRVAVEYMSMRVASESSSGKNAMVTCPVKANSQYSVAINAASIAQARLVSCAGNV